MSHQADRHRRSRLWLLVVPLVLVVLVLALLLGRDRSHGPGRPGASQPPVILSTDFDDLATGPLTGDEFESTLGGSTENPNAYEDTSVVSDPDGGNRFLQTRLDAGTVRSQPLGNNGIVVLVPLSHPVNRACLSYRVRFDAGFEWSKGGKLPGLLGVAPGVSPGLPSSGHAVGGRGWSSRVMWLGPGAYPTEGKPNVAVSYVYGPTVTSRFGQNVSWGVDITSGHWHRLQQCVVMNHVGKKDGTLRAWYDGKQVLDEHHWVFRTRPDVAVSHLAWSVFRGGDTLDWAASRPGTVDLDDVVLRGDRGLGPVSEPASDAHPG